MANSKKQVMPLPGEVLGLPEVSYKVTCPSCGITAFSIVDKEITTFSHKLSIWCSCICGSCCSKSARCQKMAQVGDLNHYCSKCGCFLGRYHPKDNAESALCHVYT